MMNSLKQSKWVFSAKEDLTLFGGGTIAAFFMSFIMNPLNNIFWLFLLFDQPHVFSTFFYTYTSDRFFKRYKTQLILIPLISFSLSYYFFTQISDDFAYAVLRNFAAFHFVKQQCAWFFISGAKEKKIPVWRKYERLIDNFAIYSCVAGPLLLSMTETFGRSGWRREGDLITVPVFFLWPIYITWAISVITYLTLQIKKYHYNKTITWGKHFHLVNATLIWIAFRLLSNPQLIVIGQFLIVFGHSFPYLYLGLRYHDSRKDKERFWHGIKSIWIMAFVVISGGILITYSEIVTERNFYPNGIIPSIWMGIIFTHFLIDTFMWKYETHPEGLDFLREKSD